MQNIKQIAELYTVRMQKDGRYHIKTEDGWISYAIYVAKNNPEICGEYFEGCEVHHKDLNRLNDKPENLICLSKEEHGKLHGDLCRDRGRKIKAYKDGVLIGVYNTIKKCSEATGVVYGYISKYLANKVPKQSIYNYDGWHFEDAQ